MQRRPDLEQKITPTLDAMGYEVVRVAVLQVGGRTTLQVMADRADGSLINVDDCTEISRTLSAFFDVEDPMPGAYDLEVSSAGIDRPLTRLKDFVRFAGFEAKVDLKMPQEDGRRRFRGKLGPVTDDGMIPVTVDGETHMLAFDNVSVAKLVLTDDLIAAATGGADQAE